MQDTKKKADEREMFWLEKRYRLPEAPTVLCHPAQHRSLDKFTCEVMSLSILLDYRPEDTKKHCFEVSLFAELFNEMLMRDFGFNIYKTLFSMPDVEQQTNGDNAKEKREKEDANINSDNDEPKEKRSRKDDDAANSESTANEKAKTEVEKDSKTTKETRSREKDKDKVKRERRVSQRDRRDDDSDDDAHSMRSSDGKRRESKKLITVDPDLLLSFIYFDQTHCGYIFSTHLEDLFYALGLRLSRADAKKIVSKVAPRSLFYRLVYSLLKKFRFHIV